MEGLVQQSSDYVRSASQLCKLVKCPSLVPTRKPSHDEVQLISSMSQVPMDYAAESPHLEGYVSPQVQPSETIQGHKGTRNTHSSSIRP